MTMKNRRQRAKQVRRRKVAQLAAYSKRFTVRNCTIPKVDESNLVEIPCPWRNKTGKLLVAKDTAIWDADNWYIELQNAVRKAKKPKNDGLRDKIKHRPWFMLSVKEAKREYKKTIPIIKKDYKEALIEHKTNRWIRKHPCPIKSNDTEPDLFEQEFLAPWKEALNKAVEHIRKVVLSKRDKLPLTGRFEEKNDTYVEKKVAEIKDKEREADKINHLNPKKSTLLKKAQKKTNQIKAKHSNLVCTNLRDLKSKRGRIILPKAA